jgi:zinc protease
MQLLRLALALSLFLIIPFAPAWPYALPVTEKTLSNGLKIIVIEDHRAPVVLQAIAYKVGASDEVAGKTGLAHYFEHLMFKGTKRYPGDSYDKLMDDNGAERNAFTDQDMTVYYARTSSQLLEQLMDIEADRMQNLVLTADIMETERKVVLEERRLRTDSDPYGTMAEKMRAMLYTVHPYGRPIIGFQRDIENYMPGNAVLAIVGDVKTGEALLLAEKHFGKLVNQNFIPVRSFPAEPERPEPLRMDYSHPQIANPMFYRNYITPARRSLSPREAAALRVVARILGGNSQSRLNRELVVRQQIATTAGANFDNGAGDYGGFYMYASPVPGKTPKAMEQAIDIVLKDLAEHGPTAEELSDAVALAKANEIYAQDSPAGLALNLVTLVVAGIDTSFPDQLSAAYRELTPDDIKQAATRMLKNNQSISVIAGPRP